MKRIAIVAGGDSSESEVSLRSAAGLMTFIPDEYEKYIVSITGGDWNVHLLDSVTTLIDKNDFSFVKEGQKTTFDFAYITIHGTPGENGILQGYFNLIGMPFSCCDVLASALTFDKYVCNQFLRNFDIAVAPSVVLRHRQTISNADIIEKLGLPLFVKPSAGGSSFGITKVKEAEQLSLAIEKAFKESDEVVVESFVAGTEVTCGMYKTRRKTVVLPVTEVVSKNEFFDYDAKYKNQSDEITPARISDTLTRQIQATTEKIYDLVGAKGIVRVDYIIEESGRIVILELKNTPGMTPQSFMPQQIKAAGLNIQDVMRDIIEDAF